MIINNKYREKTRFLHKLVKNKKTFVLFSKMYLLKNTMKVQFWWNGQKYSLWYRYYCLRREWWCNGILYKSSLNKTYEHTNQILSLGFFVYVYLWHNIFYLTWFLNSLFSSFFFFLMLT